MSPDGPNSNRGQLMSHAAPDRPDLSVVIPIYNEEETIPELVRRLTAVLDSSKRPGEVIFVNDGSMDSSLELLRGFAGEDRRIKVIDLSRNFGHQAAILAGLSRASGRAVIMMDGDLQDPPELIPDLVSLWEDGNKVVFAVRRSRRESLPKRLAYRAYYRILRSVSYVPIPVDSGDFSLIDSRVRDLIVTLPERNKFLRGLRAWAGFRQARFEYDRSERYAGDPKYTFTKLVRLALDGLVSYSFMPLRLTYLLGLIVSAGSFLLASIYVLQRLFGADPIPQGFTTLAVLMLFLGGVQLIAIGVLGEYVGRVYDEVKARPPFVESEVLNFD